MTKKTNDLVAVNVNVSSQVPPDTPETPFVAYVVDGGTVSDLRIVLVQDGIIQAGDGSVFMLPGGRIVGKSAEDHAEWHSLLENDEVHVVLVPTPTVEPDNGSSATTAQNEHLFLTRKSKLGEGVNVCDDHGPQFSGHSVIADIDPSAIRIMSIDDTQHEVIVTCSARTAAYLAAGWTTPAISSTRLVRSVQETVELTHSSRPPSTFWVTGRYLMSSCQLTLPGAHTLKPNPDLQAAVDRALAEQDLAICVEKLDAVWQCYGHVYVDSVEMGGMCHLSHAVSASGQLDKDIVQSEIERALHKKFEVQDEPPSPDTMFEKRYFKRVGGLRQSHDINNWKSSLEQPANWSVTRTLRVVPIIKLFDEETQKKILTKKLPEARKAAGETGLIDLLPFWENTMKTVTFSRYFDSAPSVLLGIHRFDFNHLTPFRIDGRVESVTTDHADLTVFTWGDTVHHGDYRFSWLAVSSDDPDLQHGTYEATQSRRTPQPQTAHRINFSRPYDAPPKVVVWLHRLRIDSVDDRIRIAAHVEDVSQGGFTLHVDTRGGSIMLEAGVSWLAHSPSRTDFASGTYETKDVHPDTSPRQKTSGHVGFDHAQFHHRPTSVFTALREFDISKTTNPRLSLSTDKVTETGMDWHIDTWLDTTLYSAGVSFIAF